MWGLQPILGSSCYNYLETACVKPSSACMRIMEVPRKPVLLLQKRPSPSAFAEPWLPM